MRMKSSAWVLVGIASLLLCCSCCAGSTPEKKLLEDVLAVDQGQREKAVRQLLGLRQAIADGLKEIVCDANEGKASARSKAIALILIGQMGLLECQDLLEAEQNWRTKAENAKEECESIDGESLRLGYLIGYPGRRALERLVPNSAVSPERLQYTVDLEQYPSAHAALGKLRSTSASERCSGEEWLQQWYLTACSAIAKPLKAGKRKIVEDEVKITAAYLLGEFRTSDGTPLLWNIDLRDQDRLCDGYPATLALTPAPTDLPCVNALVKGS